MVNRDRALQVLQEEVAELRRRVSLLEQGGQPDVAPPPSEPAAVAAPEEPPPAAAEREFGAFVAARTANRNLTYHIRTCYYAPKFRADASAGNFYPTRAAAEAAGYQPCRRCANAAVPESYVATGKSKDGKTYHRRSCRYAAVFLKSGRPYREFADRAAAETAGCRPCERCVNRPGVKIGAGKDG